MRLTRSRRAAILRLKETPLKYKKFMVPKIVNTYSKSTSLVIGEGHPTTKFSKSVYLTLKSLVTLKYAKRNII